MEAYPNLSLSSQKLLGDILLDSTNIKDEKIFYSILNMTIIKESCQLANDLNKFLQENVIKYYNKDKERSEIEKESKNDVMLSSTVIKRRKEENPEKVYLK